MVSESIHNGEELMPNDKIKRSKSVKVIDAKSAMNLMELMINSSQKLGVSVANMKNIAYLLQTYTSLRKTYKEEEEINDIIELELLNQRSEISIMLNGWRAVLQEKLGDELYTSVLQEYDKIEKELDTQLEKSRDAIKDQLKKKSNYRIGNKTSDSPAFITETIKSLSILLPRDNKEQILQFIKRNL